MPVVSRDEFGLRTSDPRSEAFSLPRQARLHVASFNGKPRQNFRCISVGLTDTFEKVHGLEDCGVLVRLSFLNS
jgi:hypothetical protein